MTTPRRERMDFDLLIIGAGPAGLAAAIRARQLNPDLSVCVLEKAAETGAHILSGAIIDPRALDELLPGWKRQGAPLATPVSHDSFLLLTESSALSIPHALMPPFLSNEGMYVASLGNLVRWLGERAEGAGVEIYPGFAASRPLFDDSGALTGVVAGEMGLRRDGSPGPNYEPGMELHGKYVLIAEGARGSLARLLIDRYRLDAESQPQKYGLGIKELWEVGPEVHHPGRVIHTMGWPLGRNAAGGGFLYHLEEGRVAVGLVTHLDYANPWLDPYEEFQRFKHHPVIAGILRGGRRMAYGARALTEGGWQSIPRLSFPGGALIGASAGFMNLPRIKGSHTAMKSAMIAAEAAVAAIAEGRAHDELEGLTGAVKSSWVGRELAKVRNVKPLLSRHGPLAAMMLGGLDMWWAHLFGRPLMGVLRHGKPDHLALRPAAECPPIDYPAPDGELSFDRLTSLSFANVFHEEDQPLHLKLADKNIPLEKNLPVYGEPAQRYCPAGVYEIVGEGGERRLQINAANCLHCKTCDIKDPSANITWTPPQGGEGPSYPGM